MNGEHKTSGGMRFSFIIHRSSFIVSFLLLLLAPSGLFAQPDDSLSPAQRRLRRGFHERVGWHLVNGVWMQPSGACNWSDLIRLSWRGQHLSIEAKPSDKAIGLLRGGRTAAVEMGPAKDLYQIAAPELPRGRNLPAVREPIPLRAGQQAIYLTATELPETDRIENPRLLRPKTLIAANDLLRVMAEGDVDGSTFNISFMSQVPAGVQLSVSEVGKPQSSLNFSIRAASLDELHQEHRSKVRKFLSPLLRVLSGEESSDLFAPGAADVYAVFAEIEPTPQAMHAVQEILPRMTVGDYDTRMAALEDLRKLGRPGVCTIAKLARGELTAQQIFFIEQVLKENSRRADAIAESTEIAKVRDAKLRDDRVFLIDCLEFADARVRAAAVRELGRILNRTFEFDPTDARAAARLAYELREEVD